MCGIKKIDHFVITTAKPKECTEFYATVGFTVKDCLNRYELFAGDFKINVHIAGKELLPHAQHITHGSADFCLEIDTPLDEMEKKLTTAGFYIELGIVERTGCKGKMRSLYLRDPDGNLLELCSYV